MRKFSNFVHVLFILVIKRVLTEHLLYECFNCSFAVINNTVVTDWENATVVGIDAPSFQHNVCAERVA